jgi:hypothetical protein
MSNQQLTLVVYWLLIVGMSAFFLRMACSICQTDMPSWRRAVISTLLVSFLAYLVFDFTGYLILRSLKDVTIYVPPWYSYALWFREPIALKWAVISMAGPLKYIPFVFALCAAGVLQVIVLQAQVTFRFGLLIFLMQWIVTVVAGYILALVFGVALSGVVQPTPVAQPPAQAQQQRRTRPPAGRQARSTGRARMRTATPGAAPEAKSEAEPNSLQLMQQKVDDATREPREYLNNAGENFKEYADSQLADLEEDLAPVVNRLPQPVQDFLARGGWWVVFGVLGVVTLLWLRSLVRRLVGATRHRGKRKKRGMKKVGYKLREDLRQLGESFTEEGDQRITVKGLPARLRLVVLSLGSRNAGELSEEMSDRVLDWIKAGLAEATATDYPRVRVWPVFYSHDGFATAFAANVPIPEPKGTKSRWVLVSGQVRMGKAIIHVGLGLYADEPNTLRNLTVKGEKWAGVISVKDVRQPVGAR